MSDPFAVLKKSYVAYEKTVVRMNLYTFQNELRSLICGNFCVKDYVYVWRTAHKFLYINYENISLPFLFANLSDVWENIIL